MNRRAGPRRRRSRWRGLLRWGRTVSRACDNRTHNRSAPPHREGGSRTCALPVSPRQPRRPWHPRHPQPGQHGPGHPRPGRPGECGEALAVREPARRYRGDVPVPGRRRRHPDHPRPPAPRRDPPRPALPVPRLRPAPPPASPTTSCPAPKAAPPASPTCLLCSFHHLTAVHRWGWAITLHPDTTITATSPDGKRTHGPPPEPHAQAA